MAPEAHKIKAGTPTMGSLFIFSTIIATILTAKLNNFYVVGGLLTLIFFLIGIQDDYRKISKAKNSAGLSARMKLLLSSWVLESLSITLLFGHTSDLYTPFYKYPILRWIFLQ